MDLSKVSTEDLRAELAERQRREEEDHRAAFEAAHPCPECGGKPVSAIQDAVEEHRFAPRDDEGRPMLFMPYDSPMGVTGGLTYETTITCENGHETTSRDVVWFDKPKPGMPLLRR